MDNKDKCKQALRELTKLLNPSHFQMEKEIIEHYGRNDKSTEKFLDEISSIIFTLTMKS